MHDAWVHHLAAIQVNSLAVQVESASWVGEE